MEVVTTIDGARHLRGLIVDGKRVSWLTVTDHRMRIGSAVVRMGGVGGVGTENAERMKGYSRQVMEDSVRYMRDEGFDVSLLFGIRDFYPKFGYAVCMPACTMTMATRDAESAGAGAGAFKIRPFEDGDLDSLIDFYNTANGSRTGTLVRERPRFSGIPKGSKWGVSVETIVVTDAAGRFAGYAAYDKNEEEVIVAEVEAADTAAFPDLLYEFAKLAIDRRTGSITFLVPLDHPFTEFCRRFDCKLTVNHHRCGGGMMRIINQDTLFEKIAPELTSRVADSRLSGCSGRLGVRTDLGDTLLQIDNGAVTAHPGATADDSIELPQSRLSQLVMGYRSPRDLLTEPDISFHGSALQLAEVLFPKHVAYVWAADHF